MDFKEKKGDFREADRLYAELDQQRRSGAINDQQFDAQRRRLMVQDEEGRWWIRSRETGRWHYHDGDAWVESTPPGYDEGASTRRIAAPPNTSPDDGVRKERRRRVPLWIPVVGIGGVVLLGLVVVGWVLLPSLQSSLPDFGQGGEASGEQGGQEEQPADQPAPNGVKVDALFVHRATADNVSANSTYLDNAATNDNPDAVVMVTQNWNPGGEGDTYNDHPVGVWYDESAGRWAVFNQDREDMPEGAAFNVAVVEEPPG